MSLVVVETDENPSPLLSHLTATGRNPVRLAGETEALEKCSDGSADVLICHDELLAKRAAESFPSVAVVLVLAAQPGPEVLLMLLRSGVADLWLEDQPAEVTDARLRAVQKRAKASGRELRTRINQYESELKRDQRAGRYIQMGMLPPSPMMVGDYRLQQDMLPSHLLSGDFVDYFPVADRYFAAYVADVAGHGASSAFVTVLLKNFSRRVRREYHLNMLEDPGKILEWLNRELLEQKIDKHVSMILVVVDYVLHKATVVNAGHYPAAIVVSDGRPRYLENAGKPVGLFPKVHYTCETVGLDEDDRVVVFSDGVLEMLDEPNHEAREARLLEAAGSAATAGGVWQALGFEDRRQGPDDMTCLIVSREP